MFYSSIVALSATLTGAHSPVKIEKTDYSVYGECFKLSNGEVEILVTLDVGPRIIAYRFIGETNILGELTADAVEKTELGEWHPWGGHRLWHAPEAMPRSYAPDNDPVEAEIIGQSSVRVTSAVEPATHLQKEMYISLDHVGSGVTVTHIIKNRGLFPVELAPWALTIMNGGGTTIIPQEPFIPHGQGLLPARPLALWHYTDMSDSRWKFGKKYIQLSTDESKDFAQKIGVGNKQGWAAYWREGQLFIKRFPFVAGGVYPDFGSNFETYTRGSFMEVETLGPITKVEPGKSVTYVEHWFLFNNVGLGDTEDALDAAILPLVKATAKE